MRIVLLSVLCTLVCVSSLRAQAQGGWLPAVQPSSQLAPSRIVEVAPSPSNTFYKTRVEPSVEVFDATAARALRRVGPENNTSDSAGRTAASNRITTIQPRSLADLFGVQRASAQEPLPIPPPQPARVEPRRAAATSVVASAPASSAANHCAVETKPPRHRHWRRLLWQEQLVSAREMTPHYAYKAPYDAPYYFLPYQASDIGRHADAAANWTGNRFNPYDNRFLQAIYK